MQPQSTATWLLCLALTLAAPPAAAQSGAYVYTAPVDYSRTIPRYPRPLGFADPARRVVLDRGNALPVQLASDAWTFEPLYRRTANGDFVPVSAPGWRALDLSCPSQPVPGGNARARMIDLAAAEWAWFGLPVLDLSMADVTAVPRGTAADPFEILDTRRNFAIGPRVVRRALRLGLMEDDPEVGATIAGYWAASGGDGALRVQSLLNLGSRDAGWAVPWSAAFVSWLACESGMSQQAFRRSGSHYEYVRAAVRARDGQDPYHAYLAYNLDETLPEPGDLLCTARSGAHYRSIADVRNNGAGAMHCDLVVKTDPAHRRLYGIGGNVAQAVTLSVIATDDQGRPLADGDLAGANRWFALLKLRDPGGATHDLDDSPSMLALFQEHRRYAASTGSPAPGPLPATEPTDTAPNAAGPAPDPPSNVTTEPSRQRGGR